VGQLEKLPGDTFTPESLLELGVIRKLGDGLKVLGNGELTRKISVTAHLFSETAVQKIQAVGGTATALGVPKRGPKPKEEKKKK